MKLIPLLIVALTVYFCAGIGDKFRPPASPSPTPASNLAEPVRNPGNGDTGQPAQQADPAANGPSNDSAKSMPKPIYPAAARAVRAAGTVSVEVSVDEKGHVLSATAVSGHQLLRQAAVDAAKKAQFQPTIEGGRAVGSKGIITYEFTP